MTSELSSNASDQALDVSPGEQDVAYARMKVWNWWRLRIGWLLAVVLLLVAPRPSLAWLIAGCLLVGAGLAIRIIAASTLTKIDVLTTHGIYAHTRNPLYLGSLLVGLGFGCFGGHWLWMGVCALLFGWIYRRLILTEEDFLAARYGPTFVRYRETVPRLIPRLLRTGPDAGWSLSWEAMERNKEPRNIQATIAYLVLIAAKVCWLPPGATWWTGRIAP